jgi:hypothetical protein
MSSHIRKAPTIRETKSRRKKTLPGEPPRKRLSDVSWGCERIPGGVGGCSGAVQWGGAFGAKRSSSLMRHLLNRSLKGAGGLQPVNLADSLPRVSTRHFKRDGSGLATRATLAELARNGSPRFSRPGNFLIREGRARCDCGGGRGDALGLAVSLGFDFSRRLRRWLASFFATRLGPFESFRLCNKPFKKCRCEIQ